MAWLVQPHLAAGASMVAPPSFRNLSYQPLVSSHKIPTCNCLCPALRLPPASQHPWIHSPVCGNFQVSSITPLLWYLVRLDLGVAGPQQLANTWLMAPWRFCLSSVDVYPDDTWVLIPSMSSIFSLRAPVCALTHLGGCDMWLWLGVVEESGRQGLQRWLWKQRDSSPGDRMQ